MCCPLTSIAVYLSTSTTLICCKQNMNVNVIFYYTYPTSCVLFILRVLQFVKMNKNSWKIRARTGGIRRKIAKEYSQIIRINSRLTTTPENEPVDTASTSATSTVVHGGSVHDAEENVPEPESSLQNIQISECDDCSSVQ